MTAEPSRSRSHARSRGALPALVLCTFLAAGTASCVTENKTTGEMVPRGNQRYPWEKVKELAKRLQKGMPRGNVMLLMGSPAETDDDNNTWVYLPERYGILIPAEALQLEFENGVLADFGYRAIILGAQL